MAQKKGIFIATPLPLSRWFATCLSRKSPTHTAQIALLQGDCKKLNPFISVTLNLIHFSIPASPTQLVSYCLDLLLGANANISR